MTSIATDSTPLRGALVLDATASGVMGALLLLAAGRLEPLLGLPSSLLRAVGFMLIPFAAFLLWLAPRATRLRAVVRSVVGGNVLWVVASILLLVSDRVDPTPLGTVFVALQAGAVAVFAFLENRAAARGHSPTAPVGSVASPR
jgi:hypothetical protein